MVRKRFTISTELARASEEYARLDNRTFSELVCEALRQHLHRYPKTRKNGPATAEKSLADRITAIEGIIRQLYPQVPYRGNGEHVPDVDGVPEAARA